MFFDNQFKIYIRDMRSRNKFSDMKGINSLAKKMVKAKKNILYLLIYLLITLTLIFQVVTVIIKRAFFAMHITKNRLCNRIRDD